MNNNYSGTESELVPGKLRGYRVWNVYIDDLGVGRLYSTNHSNLWKPRVNKAVCLTYGTPMPKILYHSAPLKSCSCGLYAKYDANDFSDILNHSLVVVGVIEAYGKIQLGTNGFRAQYAEIVAIAPYFGISLLSRNVIKSLAMVYGVEFHERVEYLIETHPQSDLSGLLPKEENVYEQIKMLAPLHQIQRWMNETLTGNIRARLYSNTSISYTSGQGFMSSFWTSTS